MSDTDTAADGLEAGEPALSIANRRRGLVVLLADAFLMWAGVFMGSRGHEPRTNAGSSG